MVAQRRTNAEGEILAGKAGSLAAARGSPEALVMTKLADDAISEVDRNGAQSEVLVTSLTQRVELLRLPQGGVRAVSRLRQILERSPHDAAGGRGVCSKKKICMTTRPVLNETMATRSHRRMGENSKKMKE